MKRHRQEENEQDQLDHPPWNTLTAELLELCMSYCNSAELFASFRTCSSFRQAAQETISHAETLHLSFLLLYSRLNQEECVSRLLESTTSALKRLELVGLRHVQGTWLQSLLRRCPNLVSLNLGGCASLDPELLRVAIYENYRRNDNNKLVEVNLRGRRRINHVSIQAVGGFLNGLTSLQMDGCSQTIDEMSMTTLLALAHRLNIRVLDMAGLNRIRNGEHALYRFPALEYLNMEGCERMNLHVVRSDAESLCRYLGNNEDEIDSRIRRLANHLGDVDELRRVMNSRETLLSTGCKNLIILNLSNVGGARGLPAGALGAIAVFSGGKLREVNVSGCELLDNLDIRILAGTCGDTLTTLEARACSFGDLALDALGRYCTKLANLDLSACFRISDGGIACLTPNIERGCPSLRSLKIANIPNLTDEAVLAICGKTRDIGGEISRSGQPLKRLLVLSVRACTSISSWALREMMSECTALIDLDARGVHDSLSRTLTPPTLRFLNGQRLAGSDCPSPCCTIVHNSQRLIASQGVSLQPMYACLDCKLRPSTNHGICSVCVSVCHEGHRTYLACFTRFYCDCAFGVSGNTCKAFNREVHHAASDRE